MGVKFKSWAIFVNFLTYLSSTSADTYSVHVGTEDHINLVSPKFLSFTVDPKYLLSSSEKYNSKECICMATSLTPAYIRIAGTSTSQMTFTNTTIAIDDSGPRKVSLSNLYSDEDEDFTNHKSKLAVKHSQWEKFIQWAKNTGFDLVFALNSDEKTASGMWDPNSALNILTAAEKANIRDVFWQLGYECKNQSIEEYLNDLETLRVIVETFPSGKAGKWKVVGGDVTHCLQADSKSDFKDYVTLSNDMMDAILLNGNSSAQELERMSEKDRLRMLKLLSTSDTPLWLTEHSQMHSELERAADWMTSLGYSARNGFSVHYRELIEKELYEPSLSFYMALLYKNLVGERVLSVELEASQAILFAHCASLRRRPVPGAVAFYGANMADEPARFSIKMSKKEEGGDIMQFILGHDRNGNIVVNGRPMYYEGDIRPVVKRVRPYKTLLINLPPKSFGFWVLANTQIQACYEEDNSKSNNETVDTIFTSDENEEVNNNYKRKSRLKRNVRDIHNLRQYEEYILDNVVRRFSEKNTDSKERFDHTNNEFKPIPRVFILKSDKTAHKRLRRQTFKRVSDKLRKGFTRYKSKLQNSFDRDSFRNNIFSKLKSAKDHISRLNNHKDVTLKGKRNISVKRNFKDTVNNRQKSQHDMNLGHKKKSFEDRETKTEDVEGNIIARKRRSANFKNKVRQEEESSDNEIDLGSHETLKLGKIFHKLKKFGELPLEIQEKNDNNDYEELESTEGIVLKTKVSENGAVIDISEKSPSGLLKSTLQDILSLLADFNKNINRFWTAVTFLE